MCMQSPNRDSISEKSDCYISIGSICTATGRLYIAYLHRQLADIRGTQIEQVEHNLVSLICFETCHVLYMYVAYTMFQLLCDNG